MWGEGQGAEKSLLRGGTSCSSCRLATSISPSPLPHEASTQPLDEQHTALCCKLWHYKDLYSNPALVTLNKSQRAQSLFLDSVS